jgi:hypothetical protein
LIGVALLAPQPVAAVTVADPNGLLTSVAPAAVGLAALQQEPARPGVDVNITKTDGEEWYKSPIVIGLAVIVVVLLVAMASRGGGTTVVKE